MNAVAGLTFGGGAITAISHHLHQAKTLSFYHRKEDMGQHPRESQYVDRLGSIYPEVTEVFICRKLNLTFDITKPVVQLCRECGLQEEIGLQRGRSQQRARGPGSETGYDGKMGNGWQRSRK